MVKIKKKKILLIHRFFYPDSAPYATILEDMRNLFKANGYAVDVLSSQPSYKAIDKSKKEKIVTVQEDGSTIYRLPVFKLKYIKLEKLLNFFWFPVSSLFFLIFIRKYDVITVSTAPQVFLAFLTALVSKLKGSKLVYHCLDIHPEIGKISGEFKNEFIFSALRSLDNYTCKVATKIVVLSDDMKNAILNRNKDLINKITIINNYDLSLGKKSNNIFFKDNEDIKRVVFTGNIGRFQNLDSFILAIKNNKKLENFELVFVGDGVALDGLKHLSASISDSVKFIPHQSIAVARGIISEADFGLVSLRSDVIKYAYPSKTMTYLSEGVPIIVSVDISSEIANFVKSEKIGLLVEPNDINKIYQIFKQVSAGTLEFDRNHVKKVFNDKMSKKQFDKKFNKLIKKIIEEN